MSPPGGDLRALGARIARAEARCDGEDRDLALEELHELLGVTASERDALGAWAAAHGRRWKAALLAAWAHSDRTVGGSEEAHAVLLGLRNRGGFGPRGLRAYRG